MHVFAYMPRMIVQSWCIAVQRVHRYISLLIVGPFQYNFAGHNRDHRESSCIVRNNEFVLLDFINECLLLLRQWQHKPFIIIIMSWYNRIINPIY